MKRRYRCSAAAHQHLESNMCKRMPLFRGDASTFAGIQTTSKPRAQRPPAPPLPSRRRVYCECVHSEATGPFISFFSEVGVAMEHKKQRPGSKPGGCVGLRCRTSAMSLPVNLYNLFLLFWLRIVIYFNVRLRICFNWPLLSTPMLPFLVFVHYFVVCLVSILAISPPSCYC